MTSAARRAFCLTILWVVSSVAASGALAQSPYPSKTVRILVGFGSGGATDTIIRLYGQKMAELLGTSIVVENRPGANQLVAIRALLQAPPDGYTLYAGTKSSLVQNPVLRTGLGYEPLKDFSLVGLMATIPGVIFVNVDLPVRSIAELVAYATARPGSLNYGSAGVGSADHLAAEAFQSITGTRLVHIPYKSAADEIREAMTGNVHLVIAPLATTVPFIKANKIRALALLARSRIATLPEVPTVGEVGVRGLSDLEPHTYIALVGPAGMPPPIVTQLNDAINKVSAMSDVASRVRDDLGSDPAIITPVEFRESVVRDLALWKGLAKNINLPE